MRRKDSLWQMALPDEKPGGGAKSRVMVESLEVILGNQRGLSAGEKRICGVGAPAGIKIARY
jgi:hypothetical protein